MPGVNLNLPIPSLSDTQTQAITKIAQALTLVNTDLAAQVISSEIFLNTSLSANGNSITNLSSIRLSGAPADVTVPGTIFYTGEYFLVTGTTTLQLTNNGALNVALNGGIGGDYGTSAALVSYDNAGQRYRFFGAGGASLVALDAASVVTEGTLASATFGIDNTTTTAKSFVIKALPAAGIGLIAYDSAAGRVVDAAGATIAGVQTFSSGQLFAAGLTAGGTSALAATTVTTLAASGDVTFSGLVKHANSYSSELPLTFGTDGTGGQLVNNLTTSWVNGGAGGSDGFSSTNTTFQIWGSQVLGVVGLRANDQVKTVTVRINKLNATASTLILRKKVSGGASGGTIVQSTTTTTTGISDLTLTITTPTAIGTRERWWVEFIFPAVGDQIINAGVTWIQ